jgi:hypothetical protein
MRVVLLALLAACQPSEDPRQFAARAAERRPSDDFSRDKRERIDSLRTMHAVIAAQPALIERLAVDTPLTEAARAALNEKLVVLAMRLDETGDAVESLVVVEAKDWSARDAAVSDAMSRLALARDAAWRAVIDGERLGSS